MASHRIGAAGGLSHDSAGPSNLHHHHVPYATSLHQGFMYAAVYGLFFFPLFNFWGGGVCNH